MNKEAVNDLLSLMAVSEASNATKSKPNDDVLAGLAIKACDHASVACHSAEVACACADEACDHAE